MSSFCAYPWRGLSIYETGQLRPCCKIDASKIEGWNVVTLADGMDAYNNNPGLANLKRAFLNGEKHPACDKCWTDEKYGIASHRTLISQDNELPGIGRLDIVIGNLCNLKCRTCSPDESTRYHKESRELWGETTQRYDVWGDHNDLVIDLMRQSDYINIIGGEPWLMTDHFSVLREMKDSGQASNVKLQYHTNGTIPVTDEMLDIWSGFQDVEIIFSLDGVGKVFEYNRHPAKWPSVEKNILQFKEKATPNIRILINTVLSIFTVDDLEDLFNWAKDSGLPPPHLQILRYPAYYQVGILPMSFRQELKIRMLKQKNLWIKAAIGCLDEPELSHLLPMARNRITATDRYRNESFSEIFPRVAVHVFG